MRVRKAGYHSYFIVALFASPLAAQETLNEGSPSPSPIPRSEVNPEGTAEAERVVVTGSNIPTAEEVGPNPVDTYRQDDIKRLGVRTPTDFVLHLPVVFGGNINENQTATAEGSTTIGLRGLDPKETLVLQDGRRVANAGLAAPFVDFNVFPLGLIDHIDVLKDGASPVYGADAVAGVVNVFLIHKFHGLETYASYGNTNLGFANDMGQEVAYLLAGTGNGKTELVVYAGIFNQAAIFSRDVPLSSNLDYVPFGGLDRRSGNFAGRVDVQTGDDIIGYVYQPALNGGSLTPTPHAFPNAASDPEYVLRTSLPRSQQRLNIAKYITAVPEADREYYYGSVTHDLCPNYLSFFGDLKYVRQFWSAHNAPRPFTPDIWTDRDHPFGISPVGISVPLQNPFNPFTTADYISPGGYDPNHPETATNAPPPGTAFTTGVRYRGLEGGPGIAETTVNNYAFTGGLRGKLADAAVSWDALKTWQWELGFRASQDDRLAVLRNYPNNIALRQALLDTNPATAFDPFGLNLNSQSVIGRVFVTTHEEGVTRVMTEDFRLNGDLFNLPAGPLSFAAGAQHLSDHTDDQPDALTTSGQTTGAAAFQHIHGGRDAWSIFWEFRLPITSSSWNFAGAHSLEFDYAERFDYYSDFGDTTRPKFSVRWQPFGGSPVPITLRASYIEAFHAPALFELFAPPTRGGAFVIDPISSATAPQVSTTFESNPNLRPEVAYERTFGAIVTPETWWSGFRGLTFTVDYGHLDLRGSTAGLDPQFIVNHESQYPGLVMRDPAAGNRIVNITSPTLNLGRVIQSYIDYQATQSFETSRLGRGDFGTITGTFNGTYLIDYDVQPLPDGKRITAIGKFGGGISTVGGGSYTHNRWYTSLFYNGPAGMLEGLDLGGIVHYTGQYWDDPTSTRDGKPRKVREWTTLDLVLDYTFNLHTPSKFDVPGCSKATVTSRAKESKNALPVSTAEYFPCSWRALLSNTTFSLGINNVFDFQPPFVAGATTFSGAAENGYDESTANPKGRFWYLALKKRF